MIRALFRSQNQCLMGVMNFETYQTLKKIVNSCAFLNIILLNSDVLIIIIVVHHISRPPTHTANQKKNICSEAFHVTLLNSLEGTERPWAVGSVREKEQRKVEAEAARHTHTHTLTHIRPPYHNTWLTILPKSATGVHKMQ